MDEIIIEKNIPLPKKRNVYDIYYGIYNKMEAGDSILLTGTQKTNVYDALRIFEGTASKKLAVQRENGRFRIWRLHGKSSTI